MMAYGLRVLSGNDKNLMRLRKTVRPLEHGHKIWASSWMLIDYLQTYQPDLQVRVLDFGCGWGVTGIYCAKEFEAAVTWADIDAAVLPYLNLMAESNKVDVNFLNLGVEQVRRPLLRNIDMVVASDICFCDTLIDPLRRLINRAKAACVKQILISDPGRWPFEELADHFLNQRGVELIEWQSRIPRKTEGKILKINFDSAD